MFNLTSSLASNLEQQLSAAEQAALDNPELGCAENILAEHPEIGMQLGLPIEIPYNPEDLVCSGDPNFFNTFGDILQFNGTVCVTINCVAKMGKGLAYDFRELSRDPGHRFHGVHDKYLRLCKARAIKPGGLRYFQSQDVLLFATKNHWRNDSRYDWVQAGLNRIKAQSDKLKRLALPALGCGNGNLEWDRVYSMIRKTFLEDKEYKLPFELHIYHPRELNLD